MKYSKYFGYMARNNGQPNLNNEQFRRMMNIISVEGIIQGITKIKEKYNNPKEYYKYDVDILKYQSLLNNMTKNLTPEDLFREMHELSNE
jgi:hypothetical protein